jgi:hypothetical protein
MLGLLLMTAPVIENLCLLYIMSFDSRGIYCNMLVLLTLEFLCEFYLLGGGMINEFAWWLLPPIIWS